MNVLEKILEEIDDHAIEFESFGMCDDYVSIGWIKEIIRSHMDEVDDDWIPCSERLPEESGHYLVQLSRKKVLDACCGSRMFYYDKENPEVIFADNRELETTLCDGRTLLIKPDIKMDFRKMPYNDSSFKVVVFDPPHLIHAGTGSWLVQKYGILPKDWAPYLKQGFDECMRVLETNGLLVFKWNENQIRLSDVLKVFGKKPLLGDQRGKTRWMIFIKTQN